MSGVERVVIVGASVAGLHAADELRAQGYVGALTLVGDEPHLPYDRPPLSKAVPAGRLKVGHLQLPQVRELDVTWRLGVAAVGLDRAKRTLLLSDGAHVEFDRLLIATGVRARPWPNPTEAVLEGVKTLRTQEDAADLYTRLQARPRRVVVIGAGFIGSELASACRDIDIDVTLIERSRQPLGNALGESVGSAIAARQRRCGVDLRLKAAVKAIDDDGTGRVGQVRLADGDCIETDIVVTALGSQRNIEWLDGAGLVTDQAGIACDATMRVFTSDGVIDDAIYAAGDVVRWPHPVFRRKFIAVEHWGTAVAMARHAARGMLGSARVEWVPKAFDELPCFWSNQFGLNIKSMGVPRFADSIVVTQGSLEGRRCVIAYGRDGHTVGAVAINAPRELQGYESLIRRLAPFPPDLNVPDWDGQARPAPVPARFPAAGLATHEAPAMVVGPAPADPLAALGFPHSHRRRAIDKEPG
jgi:3-phenylpropionate/trans-cinnamate dioxygenase ferredoxin reductase subunit